MNRSIPILALVAAFGVGLTGPALAEDTAAKAKAAIQEYTAEARDAWLDGKLEAVYALNRNLSALAIDTTVEGGVAHLSGKVESGVQRDLAGELALGIEGIHEVKNDLEVVPGAAGAAGDHGEGPTLAQRVEDATTTAEVKTRLLTNENVSGLAIDVDTEGDVVTLSGEVGSDAERQLAAQLAKNTAGVGSVRNQLTVANR